MIKKVTTQNVYRELFITMEKKKPQKKPECLKLEEQLVAHNDK